MDKKNKNFCPFNFCKVENKKGDISTEQLVIIIILVISFAIILIFLFQLNLKETTDKEICHNSVVTRGNSVLPKDATPLNCHTEYICITKGGGKCIGLSNPKIFEAQTKDDVYKVLADQMYDCWWMFGQGKINYAGKDLTENLYCSLCSQILFDPSIKTIPEFTDGINKKDFYNYLSANQATSDMTYTQFLYGNKDLSEIEKDLEKQHVEMGTINLDKQQYILMGITSKVSKLEYVLIGAPVAFGLTLLAPPVGITVISGTIALAVGAGTGYAVGFTVEGLSGNEYLSPSIVEVNSDSFNELKCKSIETYA